MDVGLVRFQRDRIQVASDKHGARARNAAGAIRLIEWRTALQNSGDDRNRQNAIRCLGNERLHHHPVGMIGHIGAIHQIDRTLAIVNPRVFIAARKFEFEAGHRLIGRFHFGAFHLGIEIVVDRGAVYDARDLIALVIVIEGVAVERQRAIEQRVLGAEFKGIDEFRFEGQWVDGIGNSDTPRTKYQSSRLAGWRHPPCSRAQRMHRPASDR